MWWEHWNFPVPPPDLKGGGGVGCWINCQWPVIDPIKAFCPEMGRPTMKIPLRWWKMWTYYSWCCLYWRKIIGWYHLPRPESLWHLVGCAEGHRKHRLFLRGLLSHWFLLAAQETEPLGGHRRHRSECPLTAPAVVGDGSGKCFGVFASPVQQVRQCHSYILCEGPSPPAWCWLGGCHKRPQVWCPAFQLVSSEGGSHTLFP